LAGDDALEAGKVRERVESEMRRDAEQGEAEYEDDAEIDDRDLNVDL
jgi:hypothetical protein